MLEVDQEMVNNREPNERQDLLYKLKPTVPFSDGETDLQIPSKILVSCPLSEECFLAESPVLNQKIVRLSLRFATKIPRDMGRNQLPRTGPTPSFYNSLINQFNFLSRLNIVYKREIPVYIT